jgi:virginiamycin B lyase
MPLIGGGSMSGAVSSRLAGVAFLIFAAHTVQAQRGGGQVTLPEGPGRDVVQARCVSCHALNQITGAAGYTENGWKHVIDSMIELPGDQLAAASQYLAAHFPEKPGRRPTLVNGTTTVIFKEWTVPTLGQRSRDPLQLADGTIWWTGQYGSLIGRLNPKTGEMKEYKLAPEVRPHSIIADRAGQIWFMGNANGTVGKLNPATGEITAFKMPDPGARDPHTPMFDLQGRLWFTLQVSNMVGRLVPATGEIKLITLPTPEARPYGIKVNSQGLLWVCYNGSNKIASIDPETMEVREFPLPNPGSRIRRIALTSDDAVWFADFALGAIGRLNPKTGEVKTWPSPSGPRSAPYAMAVVDDVIWYNESNQRPDTLVRFDPKTEKFQSWPIPSGVGIIRHMTVSPDGNLVFHQSSINRIGLVMID